MKNSMTDLRNHLFMALEDLSDSETWQKKPAVFKKADLERIKRITEVGKVLVESAKVEVTYLDVVGGDEKNGTGFMKQTQRSLEQKP